MQGSQENCSRSYLHNNIQISGWWVLMHIRQLKLLFFNLGMNRHLLLNLISCPTVPQIKKQSSVLNPFTYLLITLPHIHVVFIRHLSLNHIMPKLLTQGTPSTFQNRNQSTQLKSFCLLTMLIREHVLGVQLPAQIVFYSRCVIQ